MTDVCEQADSSLSLTQTMRATNVENATKKDIQCDQSLNGSSAERRHEINTASLSDRRARRRRSRCDGCDGGRSLVLLGKSAHCCSRQGSALAEIIESAPLAARYRYPTTWVPARYRPL